MKRIGLLGTTTAAFVMGGVVVNIGPTMAQILPVIDATAIVQAAKSFAQETGILDVLNALHFLQQTANDTMSAINTAIGNTTYGDTKTLLRQSATQSANYSKAQIGAQQQIVDASNTAMARVQRDFRNAQIADEHTTNPQHCASVDGGVSAQSAGIQAFGVARNIMNTQDKRGEAGPGMPSYWGQGQGVASMSTNHWKSYCNAVDAAEGLCALTSTPDADQEVSNLLGIGSYADQDAVNRAKDVAVNLIEPVAPAALRGDQLGSVNGQDAAVRRRSYNARMSLARTFMANTIASQAPSVPLTAAQTQYLQNMGLAAPDSGNSSWMQILEIESDRRVSDVGWHTDLQKMTPAGVQREVALELAMTNYLLFQNYKLSVQHAAISATHLAEDTERHFMPTTQMPTPSLDASTASAGGS